MQIPGVSNFSMQLLAVWVYQLKSNYIDVNFTFGAW